MVRKINYIILLLLVGFTSINVYAKSTATLKVMDDATTKGIALICLGLTIIVITVNQYKYKNINN